MKSGRPGGGKTQWGKTRLGGAGFAAGPVTTQIQLGSQPLR